MKKVFYVSMKKIMCFISCVFALSLLYACSSSDEIDSVGSGKVTPDSHTSIIQPIDVADSPIAEFFKAELPYETNYSESFFCDFSRVEPEPIWEDMVYVINSRQELADIYHGNRDLPEIDYDKYTLIIGQQMMPFLGFYVSKQELEKGSDGVIFNLYARHDSHDDSVVSLAVQLLYFWGIYPKQEQKAISVNVIKEFPNRRNWHYGEYWS